MNDVLDANEATPTAPLGIVDSYFVRGEIAHARERVFEVDETKITAGHELVKNRGFNGILVEDMSAV